MESNHVRDLMEAYSSIYTENEEVEQLDEDFQGAVKGALEAGARKTNEFIKTNPVGRAIGAVLSAGPGRKTPTKASGGYRPVVKSTVGEEVENWVNSLIDEGYDLSEYTWDDMCEMYMNLDEAKSQLPTRGIDPEFYSQFYGNASRSKKVKGKKTPQSGQNRYLTKQNQKRSAERYAADMGRDRTPSASDYDNHGGGSRNEQADLFDIIKGHLLDEGFADTEEAALAIMTNMSEEWKEQILDERNRGEMNMTDQQVRQRRDKRDGDTTPGGYKPYVRAGGDQRSEHEGNRGKKKVKGRVGASMRGPNDNVSNYHSSRGED